MSPRENTRPRTRMAALMFAAVFGIIALMSCEIPQNFIISNNYQTSPEPPQEQPETTKPRTVGARLDEIIEAGVIVVAMSPDFAPMEFIDSRKEGLDRYVGTDPWFAKYIADELNVKLAIAPMDFNSLQESVYSGKADIIMSGLGYTESRAESLELSICYNIAADYGQGLLILKGTEKKFQKSEDLKNRTVAVQENTLQHELLSSQLPDAKPKFIPDVNNGVKMLLKKEVDAIGVDGLLGLTICDNYPDLTMAEYKFKCEPQTNVIGMPKGETALCARINEIITKAEEENRFKTWIEEAEALAREIGWRN